MLHVFNGEGYHHDTPRSIGRSSEKEDGLHSLMMIIIITIIIMSEFKTSLGSVSSPLCVCVCVRACVCVCACVRACVCV